MRSYSGSRRALIALAPLLACAGLTLLIFWPLLPNLGAGLHDRSDTTLNTWILAWQAHILPRDPFALFVAPIFHPLRETLALSEILWPAAPIAVPLLAATGNPVLVYNLLFLAAFPLAGFGAYLLAVSILSQGIGGRSDAVVGRPSSVVRLSAFLAGLIYAFSPHQFGHLSQLQLLSIAWLPLTLLFLDRFWIKGKPKDGVLFALCAASQTLSAFYYGFQIALAVGLYLLVRLATAPNRHTLRRFAALIPWIALAALLIVPFAVPYLRVRSELGLERSIGETFQNAATLAEYLRPSAANPLYRALPGLAAAESGLFPGLIVLALAVLGVITWPRRRDPASPSSVVRRPSSVGRGYWLLLLFAAIVLSLGPRLKLSAADPGGMTLPFAWLYAYVPGMTAIRAPGRFANTAFLALAVLAAMGVAWLLCKIPPIVRRRSSVVRPSSLVAILLAAIILAEYAGGLGRFAVQPMPPADTPLYAWLAAQPPAALIELPLTSEMAGAPAGATGIAATSAWPDTNLLRYQYFQTGHWQPMVDGYSGFVPPHHRELGLAMAHFPDERSLALLRGLDVERVVAHADLLDAFQPGRAAALREALAQTPGVSHERDFGREWVYRLLPEPERSGQVTGRFWSADDGQAFLILSSEDGRDVVIPPGQPLRVRGSWQPAGSGSAQPFEASVQLPLMVGAGSVVPLDLPGPAQAGATTLRLAADDARLAIAPYERQATVKAGANPLRLTAIQAGTPVMSSDPAKALPGQPITLTLPWRLLDRPDADASVSARVLDARGQVVAQHDRALGGDVNLVRAWQPGLAVTTTHALRLPDAPGRYTLQAFLYRPAAPPGDAADTLFLDAVGEPTAALNWPLRIRPAETITTPLPPPSFQAQFGDQIYLLAADVRPPVRNDEPLRVALTWAAARPPSTDYTVFAHVVSLSGEILAQRDAPPQDGRYPTSAWSGGEVVTDTLEISLPSSLAGQTICLRLGLYDSATGARLPRADAADDFWQDERCWETPK